VSAFGSHVEAKEWFNTENTEDTEKGEGFGGMLDQ
jgi:hypothetical protein